MRERKDVEEICREERERGKAGSNDDKKLDCPFTVSLFSYIKRKIEIRKSIDIQRFVE